MSIWFEAVGDRDRDQVMAIDVEVIVRVLEVDVGGRADVNVHSSSAVEAAVVCCVGGGAVEPRLRRLFDA